MPVDGIFGSTVDILGKSLDLRAKNHNHISANVANAETPGYMPTRLSFESELKDAVKGKGIGKGAVTHPRHIPLKGKGGSVEEVAGTVVETPAKSVGMDNNAVELENEMGKMAENQIMYNASVQLLGKKFEGLKYAIKGGN
ncbi:flagellar basal body rod protein FlgB [Geotalea daltonii FRC-32]|uniref:Flagellar basal body rod protein FlgB n=1 Tax=Geotalea daltonii (strain DSM 22248 / JCM 15807 / FRC-32) TaxID=316067 RepID=B9LZP6_GEODF|nr:flagellar basal body rod protein FlgB [Geotalea daltonii]ACM18860.1 flagellar basal body rod protein FlgB [Geotalea daltonii FRC-32]